MLDLIAKQETTDYKNKRETIRLLINNGVFPKSFLVENNKLNKEVSESSLNKAMAIVEYGQSIGMTAIQSVSNLALINGKMCAWGDGLLSIILAQGLIEDIQETFDKETNTAYCTIKRKGMLSAQTREFSFDDAKTAGIFDKGVWKQYPKRMAQMRARGFALRDIFADRLNGIISREEAMDYPINETINVTDSINSTNSIKNEQKESELLTSLIEKCKLIQDKNELVNFYKNVASSLNNQEKNVLADFCKKQKEMIENQIIEVEKE